jgi:hypothetical protein
LILEAIAAMVDRLDQRLDVAVGETIRRLGRRARRSVQSADESVTSRPTV